MDYAQIPWRSSSFDEEELTAALATQARAQNAFDQLRQRGGKRAIGFCCSRLHADFMADFFNERGIRSVTVHSGETSAPRRLSLEALQAGDLDIVFAVDILNEGVDLPEIDTILMLRPTELVNRMVAAVWKGLAALRSQEPSRRIGLHRQPSDVPDESACFAQGGRRRPFPGPGFGSYSAEGIRIPAGLRSHVRPSSARHPQGTLRATTDADALEAFYVDFRLRHGQRPTAIELFHAGFRPQASGHGSWFAFV